MNPKYSMYRLHAKVRAMEQFLNLDRVTDGEKNAPEQVLDYFRINDPMYRLFHSTDGFMHFRVSQNGCYADTDVYYQPDFIAQYIPEESKVLELGPGQGANIIYLAHCFPRAKFCGVDLQPLERADIPPNVHCFQRNYSDLRIFRDNTFDVVYGVETIVHCTDKEQVFREVYRVLKPGGRFIVYDYSLHAPFASYDSEVRKAIELISKGGAAAIIESAMDWEQHFANCGFKPVHIADIGRKTLPDLWRLDHKASHIMKRPKLAGAMFTLLPDQFVNNIILGYLGFDSCNAGVIGYSEWVFEK